MTQRLCHQGSGWTLLSLLPLLLLLGAAPPAPPTKEAATPPHACCAAAPPTASRNALPETSLYRMQSVWQDQNGHEMHLSDLAGEVRVVAMIFTHCQYACPRILQQLRELEQSTMTARPGFVLISFDSARDDPATLKAYARAQGLDPAHWTLLHGQPEDVRALSVVLDVPYQKDAAGNFSHASVISVLDSEGRVMKQMRELGGDLDPCREAILTAGTH
ncbi:MAG: SCO family protein [Candidatus Delongbacteria bacterium]|nr:SCO family protein [Candidatus Cloacimonadota bacterium]MCB9474819.1 SCO family protein [Candidatus Delongbacteria bacterium]